ncbi:MAG TPA: TRAFs-binding domain-containing protein [Polyangiaceae bacterium]|nr:TRAFs-binding domain-containing protein [Polyangiaceae bacterium]
MPKSKALRPLCFVLMPFGKKNDPKGGRDIDFDRVYETAIREAVEQAGMIAIRADAEITGGFIHKALFERLLLCDYAVADLSTANANVFYELGVRHATRPHTTIAIYAKTQDLPFDVKSLRCLAYDLGARNAFDETRARALRTRLTAALKTARKVAHESPAPDSPLFQLLKGYEPGELAHLETDSFRERVSYSEDLRQRIRQAQGAPGAKAAKRLKTIERELARNTDAVELAGLVDLFLAYRAIDAFAEMTKLYAELPEELRRTVMVREQLAFALNRLGKDDQALDILQKVEAERGPNPETSGLIGRIHKDRWARARKQRSSAAAGHLEEAIAAYVRGYEADWRDFYPGINAVTLLDVRGGKRDIERRDRLLPVVEYAVERHSAGITAGYWEHATVLELAVLRSDEVAAEEALGRALAAVRERFEPATTATNLGYILDARRERGEDVAFVAACIKQLQKGR